MCGVVSVKQCIHVCAVCVVRGMHLYICVMCVFVCVRCVCVCVCVLETTLLIINGSMLRNNKIIKINGILKKEERRHVWVLHSDLKEVKILKFDPIKENGLYSNLGGWIILIVIT